MSLLRKNTFTVVGTLKNYNKRSVTMKDGSEAISAKATVVSVFNGTEHEYEIEFFAKSITNDKKPNSFYKQYENLENAVNSRVSISGELRESRYWNARKEQLSSYTQLSGKFINSVVPEQDSADFTLGGFLVDASPVELKNKDGEVYAYRIRLAQANYNEDNLSCFTLNINPTDVEILRGIKTFYKTGDTVTFYGVLDFTVSETAVEIPAVFGKPTVRTYRNINSNLTIVNGSPVFTGEEDGAYSQSVIRTLIDSYKATGIEIQEKAASSASKEEPMSRNLPKIDQAQTSLF